MASESLGDILDMLEEIESGYDDDFKWVDQSFIASIRKQVDENNYLSEKQKAAVWKIYTSGGKK